MSTPVPIDSLTATPLLVKSVTGVLETLHFQSSHEEGLWVHAFDRNSADGILVGSDPPAFRWYVPGAPETPDPTTPPSTYVPMLRFARGIVLAAVEEYSGGATGPTAGALRGGVIVE